jgi:hypothetical protein
LFGAAASSIWMVSRREFIEFLKVPYPAKMVTLDNNGV